MSIVVDRRAEQARTTYTLRRPDGSYLDSLTFRDVMALVAAEEGRVRARWHGTHSYGWTDYHLIPECDDFGVGYGTLTGLQDRWGREPLLERCGTEDGPLGLTEFGRAVLAEIRALVRPTTTEPEEGNHG